MSPVPGFTVGLALVMAGGAVGAALRWLVGQALLRQMQNGFPWATFAVNLVGAFVAGWLLVRLEGHPQAVWLRPLLVVGLLGGLTTFSSLMVEVLVLGRGSQPLLAGLYLALSLVGGLLLASCGMRLGMWLR